MSDETIEPAAAKVENTTPDEIPAPKPVEAKKPPEMLEIEQRATIDWYGSTGELESTESYYRSLAALYNHLNDILARDENAKDKSVEVYLKVRTDDPSHPNHKLVIARGKLTEVVEKLSKQHIPSPNALQQLQLMISQLAEMCALKGIVITGVFDNSMAGGFGFLSDSSEVTESDIVVLGESAASQAELFKTEMRAKRGIKFPTDSKIITPGQFGSQPVLKVRKGGLA